jgi:hypothetical protein
MTRTIDVFAAALARHGDAKRAAGEAGLAPSSANGMLQRLRREMGAQAGTACALCGGDVKGCGCWP